MGNAGDALINHSLYSTLKHTNIPFNVQESYTLTDISKNHTYLLMVNGGLHGPKHPMDDIINRITLSGGDMILFSATINQRDNLLKRLHERTTIVCREPITYKYVSTIRPDLTVILSEDATMAIADGHAAMPNPLFGRKIALRIRTFIKTGKLGYSPLFGIAPFFYGSQSNFDEYFSALRCDNEKAGGKDLPKKNIDLSLVVSIRHQTPEWAEACAGLFLQIIKSKDKIITDRLHVAIGCGLTGTECLFSPNNYYKCQAIFKHSLQKRFAHIKWKNN